MTALRDLYKDDKPREKLITKGVVVMENKHHRRSIRLKNYDYSTAGCYFVTICTQSRLHLFGAIIDGEMLLGEGGRMIHTLWYEIMDDFSNVRLHEFVIMSNHIHGIIEIMNNVGVPLVVTLYINNV